MNEARAEPLAYHVGWRRLVYPAKWAVILPLTGLYLALGIVVTFFDGAGQASHRLARNWARLMLRLCGIDLEISGASALPLGQAFVFVANHHSAVDIPVLVAALPVRFRMLAKASLFRIPLFGWYLRRVGYVPVQRDGGSSARRVLHGAGRHLGAGSSILVFAQGTRSPEGTVGPFKRGGSYLARAHGLPLVPVALVNTGRLLPSRRLRIDPGVAEVRIGVPLHDDGTRSHQEMAEVLRAEVLRLVASAPPHDV